MDKNDYKSLDLKKTFSLACSIVGIATKKVKQGRVKQDSALNAKIDSVIEIYVKYVLDNNQDNYDRKTIVSVFNGYDTKVTSLSKKFESKGLSEKNKFFYKELCSQIENNK